MTVILKEHSSDKYSPRTYFNASQADSNYERDWPKSDITYAKFQELVDDVLETL